MTELRLPNSSGSDYRVWNSTDAVALGWGQTCEAANLRALHAVSLWTCGRLPPLHLRPSATPCRPSLANYTIHFQRDVRVDCTIST